MGLKWEVRTMNIEGFGVPVMHSKPRKAVAVEPIVPPCFWPCLGIFKRCIGLEVDDRNEVQWFGA